MKSLSEYKNPVETDEEYHSKKDFLSSHRMLMFDRCPKEYHDFCCGRRPEKDNSSFALGRAIHCIVLEGMAEFNRRYSNHLAINEKTGKPYGMDTKKQLEQQEAIGKILLSHSDWKSCMDTAASVESHQHIMSCLTDGKAEQIFRTECYGFDCQIRADYVRDGLLIDLKSTKDIDWFEYDFKKYRYINQLAFYRDVLEVMFEQEFTVAVVAVEKTYPYRSGIWEISSDFLQEGSDDNLRIARNLLTSVENEYYPTGYEDYRIMTGGN